MPKLPDGETVLLRLTIQCIWSLILLISFETAFLGLHCMFNCCFRSWCVSLFNQILSHQTGRPVQLFCIQFCFSGWNLVSWNWTQRAGAMICGAEYGILRNSSFNSIVVCIMEKKCLQSNNAGAASTIQSNEFVCLQNLHLSVV